MRKLLLVFALLLGTSAISFAQGNTGHHSDNYSGVYALDFNPAEIVDSRYRFHMNIIAADFTVSNNYLGYKFRDWLKPYRQGDPAADDAQDFIVERLNGNKKAVYLNYDVTAPLSMMFNFGKKKENAIGINIRTRGFFNANGIEENLARQSYYELDSVGLQNIAIQNKNFSLQSAAWNEIGLTYGREVFNTGKHFLKAAGTFKITQGMASAYFYSDNLDVTFPSDTSFTVVDSDVRFGYSEILSDEISNASDEFKFSQLNSKIGLGFDFGATYEWRPNIEDHKYEMNGDPDYLDPRKNKYRLKVGLGLIDMGYVKFERNQAVYDEFNVNAADVDIDETFGSAFDDFENTGLQGFADTIATLGTASRSDGLGYSMALPMRINTYVDYNLWKGFYGNFTASIAPAFKKNPEKTRGLSEFSLTPRYEHKWFAFYLPFSMNSHGNFHMGTGMRIGPLAFGTNDILPLMTKKTAYDANIYMSLAMPIGKKLRDKDKDHVSKKFDNCRKDPGTWATEGCPDSDEDGLTDDIDECPEVKGVEEFNGCPDTDGDGIQDSEDDCPEIAGVEAFNGCPDTDEDGISDEEDECPEVAGVKEFFGCPDSDEDGVQDSEDDCPNKKGSAEFNGCPDSDGDGLGDLEDNCPEQAGPKTNKGCPENDSDADGVIDAEDDCPNTFGLKSNKGCPEIKAEDKEVINIAFENLEFQTGKDVIKSSSYESLKNLTTIMKENKDYNLRIAGHTDNVGSEASNLVLSRKRAEAVKSYLVKNGIDANRFVIEAYGETKPKASNETATGRQTNRRVELEIIFK